MNKKILQLKTQRLARRRQRVRAKSHGTAQMPRCAVFRSTEHIYAQLIDDEKGNTIASASSLELRKSKEGKAKKGEQAFAVGKLIAERAKKLSITHIVFDRGGRLYHGRIKMVADGAREGGLQF